MIYRNIALVVMAGALLFMPPVLPGSASAAWAAETPVQPALLWSQQSLRGGELNIVVFWSPGLGLEPRVRVKPTAGKVTEVIASGDRITVHYQAPALSTPSRVHFEIKGKGEAGAVAGTVEVLLEPSALPPIQIELDPPVFNFGDAGVRVKLTPPHSTLEDGGRDLQVSTSLGTIDAPMSAGDGSWVTRWEPPGQMDSSTVVLITASEPGHPDEVIGWTVLPVQVKRELSFQVEPSSHNILRVGSREWGPIQADGSGVVHFDAALDPRLTQGQLQSISDGLDETRTVDLFWETPDVIAMVPAPQAMVTDPTRTLGVHMLVIAPDGTAGSGDPPQLSITEGSLSTTEKAGPGHYRADLIPPAETSTSSVLTMQHGGQSLEQRMSFLARAPIARIQVDPAGLSADQDQTQAKVVLLDADEAAVTGQKASLHVSGGTNTQRSRLNSDGSTTQALDLGPSTFETLAVGWSAETPVTGLPPARLLAWAPGAALPADGTTLTPLVVVAIDRFGQGVPGIPLDLRIGTGGGWVTPSATTDGTGVAVVDYRAGRSYGPAQVVVRGKGLEGNAIIYQHDGLTDPPLAPDPNAIEQAWMARVSATRVSRQRPADQPAPEIGPLAIPEPVAAAPAMTTGPTPTVPTSEDGDDAEVAPALPLATEASSAAGFGMGDLTLQAGLLVLGHTYEATSDALDYAPTASFEHTGLLGAPGLDLRLSMPIRDEIGVDVRARVFTERMGAGDSVPWNLEWAVLAGASYGQELTPWFSWKTTGHLHRQSLGAFKYANAARTELEIASLANWGMRLGAGIKVTVMDVGFIELEGAETFGLRPVDHYFGSTAGWLLQEGLIGTFGFDMDIRHVRSTLETGSLEIEDRVKGVRVGIQTSF